ncbi:MAG: MgtC/SapB family protein [Acidobacteriota bacterium]|nr:MgtC/SapB family protein [Acidobacteriota bacterium]
MIPLNQFLFRLTVAALLGVAIGIERDLRKRPAGVRTSLLVSMGAALFTLLSGVVAQHFGDAGSTRIASNVVQGIGFLGAGAILRDNGIIGMTTAATIWVEAAIGMAAGAGLFTVAGFSTGLVLFSLVVLAWCEKWFGLKERLMGFHIMANASEAIAGEVQQLLVELHINPQHFRASMAGSNSIVEFDADVSHKNQEIVVKRLHRDGVTTQVVPFRSRE